MNADFFGRTRNAFLVMAILWFLWCLQYAYVPTPEKETLHSVTGKLEKFEPLIERRLFKGYKLFLESNWYMIRLKELRLNDDLVRRALEHNEITILYSFSCFGLCGREVYEISSKEKILVGYHFLKQEHQEDKYKVKKLMGYMVLFFALLIAFLHLVYVVKKI